MRRRESPTTDAAPPARDRRATRQISTITRSLSTSQLLARAPRLLLLAVCVVMITAGLRATIAGPPAPVRAIPTAAATDRGAESFAESFARVYLTWGVGDPQARERRLAQLAPRLGGDGGVEPAASDKQALLWTAVAGVRETADGQLVTIAAQPTRGALLYLAVPVGRDRRGFLYVSDYPALVGPPAIDSNPAPRSEDEVDDDALVDVVDRALRNYLAGNANNLTADLTPDALVSLPTEPMKVNETDQPTWVVPGRRVAVQITARDARENGWTLRYELEVEKRERWYVRSVQVDPTFRDS